RVSPHPTTRRDGEPSISPRRLRPTARARRKRAVPVGSNPNAPPSQLWRTQPTGTLRPAGAGEQLRELATVRANEKRAAAAPRKLFLKTASSSSLDRSIEKDVDGL